MKLKVTVGCLLCSFSTTYNVELPFDCDMLTCPSCGNAECLSIIKVQEEPSTFSHKDIQRRLKRIRELHAT